MRTREQEVDPLVNLSEITEIELLISRRMREFTMGEHRSVFHGSGFDLVGLRQWQPGDRVSSIDWAQSTITNFDPLVVREFEQPSTAAVVAVADASLSTRCGIDGVPIAAAIAHAIATIGMSAVFFQDLFGLITFDRGFDRLAVVRARIGKKQVIHCLDAYQHGRGVEEIERLHRLNLTIAGLMRRTSLVPVISDFLFENAREVLQEMALLNAAHDVVVVLIDSAFAFELPRERVRVVGPALGPGEDRLLELVGARQGSRVRGQNAIASHPVSLLQRREFRRTAASLSTPTGPVICDRSAISL